MGEEKRTSGVWSEEDNPGAYEDGAPKIGPALERRRKEQGLSLEEVEQATKIRKRYLEGLERDDYGVLPDAVYAAGFLKTYANFLGLDGEGMARELKSRRQPRRDRQFSYTAPGSSFDRPLVTPGNLGESRRSPVSAATIATLTVAVLAIGALIGGLYYVGKNTFQPAGGGGEEPAPSASSEPADGRQENRGDAPAEPGGTASGDEDGQAGEEKPPPPDELRVSVRVEGSPSWISVQSDGVVAFEQIAQPGFSQTFEAEREVVISTGNAGAVSVEVNGQSVGTLGGYGEVVTRNWTLKDAASG